MLLQDYPAAIDLATRALELKPKCFEAYYARARAKRDDQQYSSAQTDLMEALRLAPSNREVRRLLTRIKEECMQQVSRYESGLPAQEMDRISEDEDDSSLAMDRPSRASRQHMEETALWWTDSASERKIFMWLLTALVHFFWEGQF